MRVAGGGLALARRLPLARGETCARRTTRSQGQRTRGHRGREQRTATAHENNGRRRRNLAASFWIVHRDARWREALRRLVGGVPLLGDPTDAGALADEPAPRAVLLGVGGDFEAELAWSHRTAARLAEAAVASPGAAPPCWLVLAEPRDADEARRLFDGLPADVLPFSGDLAELRAKLRAALARRTAAALSERRQRDQLSARFERWLGDYDAPELLAASDPARRSLPLLVRGEPGTGRGLLARYLHLQAGTGGAEATCFASVAGGPDLDAHTLLAGLVPEMGNPRSSQALTVCVEEADTLTPAVQRRLAHWIETGPPPGVLHGASLRWMATAGDPAGGDRLEPDLARALAGLVLVIPPLRERPEAVARIAEATAVAWLGMRAGGRPTRATVRIADDAMAALHAHAWPGNARELEAVVRRTLATTRKDPIRAADLVFDPLAVDSLAGSALAHVGDDAGQPRRARIDEAPQQIAVGDEDAPAAGPPSDPAAPGAAARAAPRDDAAAPATTPAELPLLRLAGAVAHEVGNPLVGIRTFAQMLPGRFDDPEFRQQFAERVEADTRRIETVVDTLARLGSLPPPARDAVDVSGLVARLLQRQRQRIQEGRLVVLEELDREHPHASGDAEQLRFALGLLLDEALSWLTEGGDLYVATTYQPAGPAGEDGARLRLLLRSRGGPGLGADTGLRLTENTLAIAAVEAVVRAHQGSLAVESSEAGETLVLIELPAP